MPVLGLHQPKIVTKPLSVEVEEGDTLLLPCMVHQLGEQDFQIFSKNKEFFEEAPPVNG